MMLEGILQTTLMRRLERAFRCAWRNYPAYAANRMVTSSSLFQTRSWNQ